MEAFLHGTRFKYYPHSALNSFHKRLMGVLVVNLFIKSEEKFKICDRAWENQSYLHVKFDLILRV